MNNNKNIFLVCYGGGHINIIEPIVDELIKNKNYNVKLLALTTAYLKVKNKYDKNILKSIADYLFLFDKNIDAIFQNGLKIFEENYNDSIGLSKLEVLSYLGLSYSESIEKLGKEKAYEEYKKKGRQSFLPIDTIKKILEYEKASLVITTTSPRFEDASMIAANELEIETLQILDLFGELYPLPKANHIVCIDNSVSESLKKQGLLGKSYYYFGQPAIEQTIKNILTRDTKKIKNKLKLNDNKTLLYATQKPIIINEDFSYNSFPGYEIINNNIFSILEFLHKKFDINILVRLHPNEDINSYKQWFEKYNFIKYTNNLCNLEESLAVSSTLLTHSSTVSIEAVSIGLDVFTFKDCNDVFFPLPRVMEKPFIFSNGFKELKMKLDFYFSGNLPINNKAFLPFNSVSNIINLIEELI